MNSRNSFRALAMGSSVVAFVAVVAAPTVELEPVHGRAGAVAPAVHYRKAAATPNADPSAKNIKILCSVLGVEQQVYSEVAKLAGYAGATFNAPEDSLCTTPAPARDQLTERACSKCIPDADFTLKFERTLEVAANAQAAVGPIPIYGLQITCNAGAKFKATTTAKAEGKGVQWSGKTEGKAAAVPAYIDNLIKVSGSDEAALDLSGDCTADGKVITAKVSAELGISCKLSGLEILGTKASKEACEFPETAQATPAAGT